MKQQIDPAMLSNAHLIGQPRMPTESELRTMQKNALTIALASISLQVVEHLAKFTQPTEATLEFAAAFGLELIRNSEERDKDYGQESDKRKVRNQLAAQLAVLSLDDETVKEEIPHLINKSFERANSLLETSEKNALSIINPTGTLLTT